MDTSLKARCGNKGPVQVPLRRVRLHVLLPQEHRKERKSECSEEGQPCMTLYLSWTLFSFPALHPTSRLGFYIMLPASHALSNFFFFFCSLHFSLKILARLMTAKFLHTEIREKGGAYGGGAKLTHSGIFTLYSYR